MFHTIMKSHLTLTNQLIRRSYIVLEYDFIVTEVVLTSQDERLNFTQIKGNMIVCERLSPQISYFPLCTLTLTPAVIGAANS